VTLAPAAARAQACCAGANALGPARLARGEDALLGLQAKVGAVYGSFDDGRRFFPAPRGATELDLEQDLVGAVRFLHRGQLSFVLPMVETWRRVPGGRSELGGDLGDLQLGARWDFTLAGAHRVLPGIAAAARFTLPTGRSAEAAYKPMGTDATGIGAFQASAAVVLEQTFGPWLAQLGGSMAWHAPRSIGSITAQQGVELSVSAAFGHTLSNDLSLAVTLAYADELDPHYDGKAVPGGGRASTRVGLAAGWPVTTEWRLQSTAFTDLPLRFLGKSQPISAGGTVLVARIF
jgi:hypothetical protein